MLSTKRTPTTRPTRRSSPPRADRCVVEASRVVEEIVQHLPGEDRESLLVLAEEHGLERSITEASLVRLEQEARVSRRTDHEGVERWEPVLQEPTCTRTHVAGERGVLPVYSRDDQAEQRWRLVQSGVLCPICGLVKVTAG